MLCADPPVYRDDEDSETNIRLASMQNYIHQLTADGRANKSELETLRESCARVTEENAHMRADLENLRVESREKDEQIDLLNIAVGSPTPSSSVFISAARRAICAAGASQRARENSARSSCHSHRRPLIHVSLAETPLAEEVRSKGGEEVES